MPSDSRIGTDLAGYRILELLGRGGMSVVYLAEQAFPNRRVALKLLAPEISADERFRERFTRESNAAASIDHPNVIPIFGAGEVDGVLYIAMRYVEGTDLRTLLEREGPLDPARTVSIISQTAAALDAAHRHGLIHRDVKPGNILIASSGDADHVYLADFGLIKRRDQDLALTNTGQFMGSVDYVAPEQIEGGAVDHRVDVYSLGCVLFECLTGAKAFARDNEAAVMFAHLRQDPPRPTATRPELPPAVDGVVAKALAKRADDRYQSAGELAAAARQALAPVAPGIAPKGGRGRKWVAAAVAGALVVTAVAIFLASRGGNAKSPPPASPTSPRIAAPPLNSIIEIDPATHKILVTATNAADFNNTARAPFPAVGEGGVWVILFRGLAHLDEQAGRPLDPIQYPVNPGFPGNCCTMAFASGRVFFTYNGPPNVLNRLDPATGEYLKPFTVTSTQSLQAVSGRSSLWVTEDGGLVARLDPNTGAIQKTIRVGGDLDAAAYGEGAVWVGDKLNSTVVRIDPAKSSVAKRFSVVGSVDGLAAGEGAAWILDSQAGTVTPIDAATDSFLPAIRVGTRPSGLAVGLGAVWVSDLADNAIYRIDPDTRKVTTIVIGAPVSGIAVDSRAGTLWAVVYSPHT